MAAPAESLRKRRRGDAGSGSPPEPAREPVGYPTRLRAGSFWLTRIVLLRALAFVYFMAFLVAFHQNKQLIGDQGLLPSRLYLKSVQQHFKGRISWDALSYAPTILWFLDWSRMDTNLDFLALAGLGISSFVLVAGCANMVLMAALWVLYMSLVNVGQICLTSHGPSTASEASARVLAFQEVRLNACMTSPALVAPSGLGQGPSSPQHHSPEACKELLQCPKSAGSAAETG
ncbi:lipase maturation factor 1-like [Dugong dugon]